jgi:hypothetical protein
MVRLVYCKAIYLFCPILLIYCGLADPTYRMGRSDSCPIMQYEERMLGVIICVSVHVVVSVCSLRCSSDTVWL